MQSHSPWKISIFTQFLMSDHLSLKKLEYGEDLDLSEYIRSLFIAFVETELLAMEVRVFQAKIFDILNLGARVSGFSSHDKSVNMKK